MSAKVVDTNVLVVANGRTEQAGAACVIACVEFLQVLQSTGVLVVDDAWRVLSEYKGQVSSSGQPGVGDAFLRWALTNLANAARCEQVPLTERAGKPDDFEEFPEDADLAGFDPSDRKWVAIARASQLGPPIANASDTDWWGPREVLKRYGVTIEFLCQELMQRKRAPSVKRGLGARAR